MARAEPVTRTEPPGRKMTYEEFVEWCDEDRWAEWVEGEVTILMPASTRHQLLVVFLVFLLHLFVRRRGLGTVLTAPFQMRLEAHGRRSGREPDILYVAAAHRDRLLATRLEGPADLVVEVVSEESRERDGQEKRREYEAAGVAEYWLLDPDRRRAAFYGLGRHGRYQSLAVGEDGVFRSAVLPGFWLRVEWLWQEPLPDLAAARALGLLGDAAGDER